MLWQRPQPARPADEEMRAARRDMQIVFQDPLASLDPRMTIGDIIAEPLLVFEPKLQAPSGSEHVREIMDRRRPGCRTDQPLSARILRRPGAAHRHRPRGVTKPKLIICDEPVSALDVSIQAQVIDASAQAAQGIRPVADLHQPRPLRRAPDLDECWCSISAGSWKPATAPPSSIIPPIPIRRRSSPPRRSRIRSLRACAPASACRVTRPRRSTRRKAASSHRAAGRRPTSVAPKCRRQRRSAPARRPPVIIWTGHEWNDGRASGRHLIRIPSAHPFRAKQTYFGSKDPNKKAFISMCYPISA